MANEIRMRQNGVGGLLEDSGFTSSSVQMTSAGLASVVGGVDAMHHLPIIIGPDGDVYPPEIAYITSLTSGNNQTGSTGLLRGQEGTTAEPWPQGTPWLHAPTIEDWRAPGWELVAYDNCSALTNWTTVSGSPAAASGVITLPSAGGVIRWTNPIDAVAMMVDFRFRFPIAPANGTVLFCVYPQSDNSAPASGWFQSRLSVSGGGVVGLDIENKLNAQIDHTDTSPSLSNNTWYNGRVIRNGSLQMFYVSNASGSAVQFALGHMNIQQRAKYLTIGGPEGAPGTGVDFDDIRIYRGVGLPAQIVN
jgi:hypothetical protein